MCATFCVYDHDYFKDFIEVESYSYLSSCVWLISLNNDFKSRRLFSELKITTPHRLEVVLASLPDSSAIEEKP